MSYARLALLTGAFFALAAFPCSATTTPAPLFTECPQIGNASGCTYLIDFGPKGSITQLSDPNAKDADSKDNVLIGILNSSGTYLSLSGYTGPNNVFSNLHLTGGLWDGKSTYFEFDDPFESDNPEDQDDDDLQATPEPSSMLLLGTALVVACGLLRRHQSRGV